MRKAKVVLTSDVHFNIKTLDLAAASLRAAFTEARNLGVPLIIAGDLNDTKAIMRGECVNAILNLFEEFSDVTVYTIVGNHDLINEKGKAHTLNFLRPYCIVVEDVYHVVEQDLYLIGYKSEVEELKRTLSGIPSGATVIMHQGIMGAAMGEYVIDKSSIDPSELADFRVITGHYHKAQDIKCGRPRKGAIGLASYIGTPYSVTFAEATDGPKGIRVLFDDGILDQVALPFRKHVVKVCRVENVYDPIPTLNKDDLLWIKVSGPTSELDKIKKKDLGLTLLGHENFKLDRIPDEADFKAEQDLSLPPEDIFDSLIDSSEETPEQKTFLKSLWKSLV